MAFNVRATLQEQLLQSVEMILKNLATVDAGAALQGKAAGVQILNTSGAPGEGAKIRYSWLFIKLRPTWSAIDCRWFES